jgi:hypothetical protein
VLPIDACSRRLAPKLREGGYDLDYRATRCRPRW